VKVAGRVRQGHDVDAVLDLAAVAVVLSLDACRVPSAFDSPGFVDAADGLRIGLLGGDKFLAAVAQTFFVPLDRFEESLERSRRYVLIQGNRFDVLPLNLAE